MYPIYMTKDIHSLFCTNPFNPSIFMCTKICCPLFVYPALFVNMLACAAVDQAEFHFVHLVLALGSAHGKLFTDWEEIFCINKYFAKMLYILMLSVMHFI